MSRPQLPNRIQALVATVSLLWLSLVLAPLTAVFTLSARKCGRVLRRSASNSSSPTALVNGARMQKSLFVTRALARQGWRVVVVEERGWGLLSPSRFSIFVSQFVLVPSGGGRAYVDAIVDVAIKHGASLFVPCSGAGTTHEDAVAAEILRKRVAGFKAVIQDPNLAIELHQKDKFISLAQSYGLDAPHSVLVESSQELLRVLKSPNQPPRILKCAAELDDFGRSDLTLYPFRDSQGQPDWAATERRARSLGIPISKETPYLAQEFVGGPRASEWCTHATILAGEVRAFVCCPSHDMLMTYYPARETHPMHQRTLQWTKDFLDGLKQDPRWQGKCLDGHYSFDFIHKPEGLSDSGSDNADDDDFYTLGSVVAIECNPRVHTAVGLLSDSLAFGAVYGKPSTRPSGEKTDGKSYASAAAEPVNFDEFKSSPSIVTVPAGADSMSWLGHDLPARLLPLVLPKRLRTYVHPLWLFKSEVGHREIVKDMDLDSPGRRDAAWDPEDPWPFFVLYHVAWPYLLLRQIFVRRKAWSRINVSTARIFEC